MAASGYGTRVRGGDIPASSDRTAFDAIGCTNRAGLDKSNFVAAVDLGSLGKASTVTTRVWTTKRNGTVSSYARNRIAGVRLLGAGPAVVRIKGIESLSRAFHNGTGFHAQTSTRIASITLDPDGSGSLPALNVPGPTQGNPIEVAGLRISVGSKTEKSSASGALAKRDALKIQLIGTRTEVVLAHSQAKIHAGVVSALFRGNAYGAKATALDKTLRLGKTPYVLMPCQGTNGKVIRNDTARVTPGNLVLTGLSARERAAQSVSRADAFTEGRVAKVLLGHGLVVRAIVGRANAHFVRGQGITTNIKGSTFGSVTLNGTARGFGPDDVIRIAGVARLERNIVKRTPTSIEVTALQVKLLGTTVVVNLGHAKVGITKSGL
ncbi:MAG: choice-of-anchor P family protein [Nocardioidaceae bacterium]